MTSKSPKPAAHGRPFIPGSHLDRRQALKLLAGSMALALNSCGRPKEEIVPYVDMPERVTPGVPLQFATALPLGGYARGVLVTSHEGRPTKIEGNPRHPASLGASDVFAQAAVMSLYEPDRSAAVHNSDGLSSWDAFTGALQAQMQQEKGRNGSGLRILTGCVTSPTLIRQLQALSKDFPEARWHRYEPVNDDAALAGAEQAFGRRLTAIPRIADAAVILTLDADPLGPGPEQIRLGNEFSRVRQPTRSTDSFLRLYAVESCWRPTGANADERLALRPDLMRNVALNVASRFGGESTGGELPAEAQRFVKAVADDLMRNSGRAIVLAGRSQPPEIHALCHWINAQLKAPVDLIEPVDPVNHGSAESLKTLTDDMHADRVQTLLVIDSNPVHAAPGELAFGDAMTRVPFTAHLGLYDDETAARCEWHLPLSHELESWSDLRAFDGTASVVQPLIQPLYDTRTAHHLIGLLQGQLSLSPHQAVQETWHTGDSSDFDKTWRRYLHDGLIADTAQKPVAPPQAKRPDVQPAEAASGLILALAPDPSIWDGGRFSNNAWLQECPKPVTKEVWGNSLDISPKDAAAHGITDGDLVKLSRGNISVEAPAHIQEGQAEGAVAATLGYGRSRVGAIGNSIGFDVYSLQTPEALWTVSGIHIEGTGRRREMLTTQHQFTLDGEQEDILRTLAIQNYPHGKVSAPERGEELPTLLPKWPYDTYSWAMVIDTSVCIGCNACVIACQSENNIPVVGPDEVSVGRIMHWLRIDTYFIRGREKPPGFQPVPCMHCEQAPCEPVCPVAASVHDSEGLNVQVYNRCVGTRFCQSNCPYKVRRFNFFGYADGQAYANLDADVVQAHFNPDVTVRARGVMEKCTYCVQRISRARKTAEEVDRPIPEGGVVTACQGACPTRAISFGNLNNRDSAVNRLRQEPHHYAMLGHLGTRPRTTYLARLGNPNPALNGEES